MVSRGAATSGARRLEVFFYRFFYRIYRNEHSRVSRARDDGNA
jgi:hypothetical protein